MGRHPSLNRGQCLEALDYLNSGCETAWIANHFGVTERTLLRLVNRVAQAQQVEASTAETCPV